MNLHTTLLRCQVLGLVAPVCLLVTGCGKAVPPVTSEVKGPARPSPAVGDVESAAKKEPPVSVTAKKLDSQLVLALKKMRGEPPYNGPAAVEPDIPIKTGSSVLIDMTATLSVDLLNHISKIGGQVAASPDPAHVVRAMIPLDQLEALAGRDDVLTMAPARISSSSGTKPLIPGPTEPPPSKP